MKVVGPTTLAMTPATVTGNAEVTRSAAIECFAAAAVIFRILDTSGGSQEVASAIAVEAQLDPNDTNWASDQNFAGLKNDGGAVAANFLRNPAGAVLCVPAMAGNAPFADDIVFKAYRVRLVLTRAANATGNALTPLVKAFVVYRSTTERMPASF